MLLSRCVSRSSLSRRLPLHGLHSTRLASSNAAALASLRAGPDESGDVGFYTYDEEDVVRRVERKSPAALFGEKHMPAITLPSELENKMERLFAEENPKVLRESYKLFLNTPVPDPTKLSLPKPDPFRPNTSAIAANPKRANLLPPPVKRKPKPLTGATLDLTQQPLKLMPRETTKELVFAHASGLLPTHYAVMRNVMQELKKRTGWTEEVEGEEQGGLQFVDFSAGYGAAAWAAIATFPSPPKKRNTFIQIEPNYMVADLSKTLLQPGTPGPVNNWINLYYRSWLKFGQAIPEPIKPRKSVAVSSFHLSTMRSLQDRRRVLNAMWESDCEYIIVADHAFRDGYRTVIEARDYFLKRGDVEIREEEQEKKRLEALAPYIPSTTSTPTTPIPTLSESLNNSLSSNTSAPPSPLSDDISSEPPRRGRIKPVFGSDLSRGKLKKLKEEIAIESAGEGGPEKLVIDGMEFEEEPFEEIAKEAEAIATKSKMEVAREKERILGAHVLSPCPHDSTCPLLSTPDYCHFIQNLQQPTFSRMVKNTKAGNHVVKFSYCIIKRGPRPIVPDEVRGEGRMGEVGREMAEKAMEKKASVVAQGSDGVYASELGEEEGGHERENQAEIPEADMEKLRQEVQEWGRMIYPPLHKKGHISMDLCTSSGNIQRQTIGKKQHGPQVWYDVKHSAWGDAIPHASKSARVKTRGISRLTPAQAKNKINIVNGRVTGLEKMTAVQYREVAELMDALGVELPERLGKRNRPLAPKRSSDVLDKWGVRDYEGEGRDQESRAEEERLSLITKPRETRSKVDVEREAEEQRARLNEGKATVEWMGKKVVPAEWESTPLVGARVIDPGQYGRPDQGEENDGEGWGEFTDDEADFDVDRYLAENPERHDLEAFNPSLLDPHSPSPTSFSMPSSSSSPSDPFTSPRGSPASPHFSLDDLDLDSDLSSFSPSPAPPKLSLDALGPGWMSMHEHELGPNSQEARAAAADRLKTFGTHGIPVTDLGRPRTIEDDWQTLESWNGKANPGPSPEKLRQLEKKDRLRELKKRTGGRSRSGRKPRA